MIKVALTIALVAACATVAFAGPVTHVVSWEAVNATVSELEATVRNATQDIKDIANRENAQIGSAVATKVDSAEVTALDIINALRSEVTTQTLTEAKAKTHISDLRGTIARLIGSLQTELAQLTVPASQEIKDKFAATFSKVGALTDVMYIFLNQ